MMARRAITALVSILSKERRLHGMQCLGAAQALNGCDIFPVVHQGQAQGMSSHACRSQYRVTHPPINFNAEIFSADEADVESHQPFTVRCACESGLVQTATTGSTSSPLQLLNCYLACGNAESGVTRGQCPN